MSAWYFTSFSQVRLRHDNPSRLSIGWGMETRSRYKLRYTTSPPRAATVGGTEPVTDTFVEPPSSAAGHTGEGEISSRSSSLEAGPRRTCRQIPRSESAGGTRGRAQGVAFDENREATDTVDSKNNVCYIAAHMQSFMFIFKWLLDLGLLKQASLG